MMEAVLARILTDAPERTPEGATAPAVALRALAPQLVMFSDAERHLLVDWLDRITGASGPARS